MAFEKSASAFKDFLAIRQAGQHPLAQHLNFKSALKEARIAMASKELENERNRGLKRSEGALNRASAEGIASAKQGGGTTLQDFLGTGDIPVGATVSQQLAGGTKVTVPLNPRLTDQEQKIIAGAETVSNSVTTLNKLFDENPGFGKNIFDQVRVDIGDPLFTSGVIDQMQEEINVLKSIIPFAKGGKQLTTFEAKLLFRLVETKGKSLARMKRDIDRFKVEFDRLSGLATGGRSAIKNQKFDLNVVLDGIQ